MDPEPGPASRNFINVFEKVICEDPGESADCRGFYGFTVFYSGAYAVGPAPSGARLTGHVTLAERDKIRADLTQILSIGQSAGPSCVPTEESVFDTHRVNLVLPDGSVLPVYHRTPQLTCYLNDVGSDTRLHADFDALLRKYYPVPFPAPAAIVRDGHWGGEGAAMEAAPSQATLQFDCAHGVIPGPLTLDPAGRFVKEGTIVPEGGPEPAGGRPVHPARYLGTVSDGGTRLVLEVEDQAAPTFAPVTYTLHYAEAGKLTRCL